MSETASEKRPGRMLEVKVGAFVVAFLALGAGVVLLLGSSRHVFEDQVMVHALFSDVQGLKEGVPVRVSGVTVGSVSRIDFTDHARAGDGQTEVEVVMQLARGRFSRVRQDSVAHIDAQGLLGDKIVEVSVGSSEAPPLPEGGTVRTAPPADFNRLLVQASEILVEVKTVAQNAARAMEAFADPRAIADLRASFESLRRLMAQAERGDGLAHAIFYDRRTARDFRNLSRETARLVSHVDRGVRRIDTILDATDEDGAQVVNNLSRAARHVGVTAEQLHRSRIIPHLERSADDLAALTHTVRSGDGSLGALIVDPTAYEQLVTVLGGVERSRILRALVRLAIAKDDRKVARVVDDDSDVQKVRGKR